MTNSLSPEREQAIRNAIREGRVASIEEFIGRALAGLSQAEPSLARSVFEHGLGMFSSPEDSALLDEVVSLAYEERHRPTRREPPL